MSSKRRERESFAARVVDYYENTAGQSKKKTMRYFRDQGNSTSTIYGILSRYAASGEVKYRDVPGRPSIQQAPEMVDKVEKVLTDDPTLSVRAAAKKLNMARSTVSQIKVHILGMRSLAKPFKTSAAVSGERSVNAKKTPLRLRKTAKPKKTAVSIDDAQNQEVELSNKMATEDAVTENVGDLPNFTLNYDNASDEDAVNHTFDFDAVQSQPVLALASEKAKNYFVAIHLGAGKHSLRKKGTYMKLCKDACDAATKILKRGGTAEDAAVAATVVLENSGLVNAGRGSSLTLSKTVECDAGFMTGDGHFAGVGGVPGIQNPVLIAQKLVQLQTDTNMKLSCGRVPPNFLTGLGAKQWAESQGIEPCDESKLISRGASKTYDKLMKRIQDCANTGVDLTEEVGDTVGAVALDLTGRVAATVSSGGTWLKFPGRVGHAPQFGSGCWAQNGTESESTTAVSTTGVGEMLSKLQWARECANSLNDENFMTPAQAIGSAIQKKFLESELLRHHTEIKLVGMIGLTWDGFRGELTWGHTSQTMIVGYAGSAYKTAKMEFLSLPSGAEVGKAVNVGALPI